MSYINDALKKAQKERDHRYEQFRGIIAPCPDGSGRSRNRRLAIGAVLAVLALVSIGVLLAVHVLQQPPPAQKGTALPVVAEAPAAPQPLVPPAAQKTVPADAMPTAKPVISAGKVQAPAPAAARVEKKSIPEKRVPAAVKTGEKPAPAGDAVPMDGPSRLRQAQDSYQKALYAQRNGDVRGAEALYRRALSFDPGHVRALNNLGVICMERKQTEQAIVFFNKAIVLKKDYVDPYYNLACLHARKKEIDESLWYIKIAAAIDGDVINWAKKDADMKNVVASPEFKKITEEQKN